MARRGAEIGFDLERMGKRVPATDLLIAAAAIEHGYTLWHNDKRFEVIAAHSALVQRRLGDEGPTGTDSGRGVAEPSPIAGS